MDERTLTVRDGHRTMPGRSEQVDQAIAQPDVVFDYEDLQGGPPANIRAYFFLRRQGPVKRRQIAGSVSPVGIVGFFGSYTFDVTGFTIEPSLHTPTFARDSHSQTANGGYETAEGEAMLNKGKTAKAAQFLFTLLVAATPSTAGNGVIFMKSSSTQPTVQSTVVLGSVVAVTVANPARSTAVVLVSVTAVVDGSPVVSTAVLSVPPRDDSTAQVGFSGPVGEVVTVGLQEDSGPI